jgi:dCMP deaminase
MGNGINERPHINEYFIAMAQLVATRGTCVRRKAGCVLTNKNNHVLSTGYNGKPKGQAHCLDEPCSGGANSESGKDYDKCGAIHAEANALLQCKNTQEIEYCYITVFPCIHCLKLLMSTSCKTIVYNEIHVDEKYNDALRKKWEDSSQHNYNLKLRSTIRIPNIQGSIFKYDGIIWRQFL